MLRRCYEKMNDYLHRDDGWRIGLRPILLASVPVRSANLVAGRVRGPVREVWPAARCPTRWRNSVSDVVPFCSPVRQCVYFTNCSMSDPPETSTARTAWPLPVA
jgi:hypothetical protein